MAVTEGLITVEVKVLAGFLNVNPPEPIAGIVRIGLVAMSLPLPNVVVVLIVTGSVED